MVGRGTRRWKALRHRCRPKRAIHVGRVCTPIRSPCSHSHRHRRPGDQQALALLRWIIRLPRGCPPAPRTTPRTRRASQRSTWAHSPRDLNSGVHRRRWAPFGREPRPPSRPVLQRAWAEGRTRHTTGLSRFRGRSHNVRCSERRRPKHHGALESIASHTPTIKAPPGLSLAM